MKIVRYVSFILVFIGLFLSHTLIGETASSAEPIGQIYTTKDTVKVKFSSTNKKIVVSKAKKGYVYNVYSVKKPRKNEYYIGNSLWISKAHAKFYTLPIEKIIPASKTVKVIQGQEVKLSYKVSPASAKDQKVYFYDGGIWERNIATVDENGVIKGVQVGKTKVTITSGSVRATVSVEVIPFVDVQKSTNNSYITVKGTVDKKINKVRIYFFNGNRSHEQNFNIKDGQIDLNVFTPLGYGKQSVYVMVYKGEEADNSYDTEIMNKDTRDFRYTFATADVKSDHPEIVHLAQTITSGMTDEYQKAKAIHDWVATNIAYDTKRLNDNTYGRYQGNLEVLSNKAAVCGGYSYLTAALLRASGLKAKVVVGVAKQANETWQDIDKSVSNHAWNEVFIGNRWVIIDTTWDAGMVSSNEIFTFYYRTKYFDPTAELFAIDHIKIEDMDD